MEPTLAGIATCLNSAYLVIHGTFKIVNRFCPTVCFEAIPEEDID